MPLCEMRATKICSDCKEELPLEAFFARSKNDPRPRSRCKVCYRIRFQESPEKQHKRYMNDRDNKIQRAYRHQLRSRYGIEECDYDALYLEQGGCCAICGGLNNGKRLCVDHDHDTDRIRGLLCHNCNVSLGLMQDEPDRLRLAAAYLERNT